MFSIFILVEFEEPTVSFVRDCYTYIVVIVVTLPYLLKIVLRSAALVVLARPLTHRLRLLALAFSLSVIEYTHLITQWEATTNSAMSIHTIELFDCTKLLKIVMLILQLLSLLNSPSFVSFEAPLKEQERNQLAYNRIWQFNHIFWRPRSAFQVTLGQGVTDTTLQIGNRSCSCQRRHKCAYTQKYHI